MKFFWKIFFTVMFISTVCLAIGGYVFLNSNFNTLLDKEVQSAYDYGDIVYYSLAYELYSTSPLAAQEDEAASEAAIGRVAENISINSTNQKIPFCLLNQQGETVFNSLEQELDKKLLQTLGTTQKGWAIRPLGNRNYVQVVRPAVFGDQTLYIETVRNIDYIFESQSAQRSTLMQLMAIMFVLAGVVTWVISKLLMGQIVSLTKATKSISAGNLKKRVQVVGEDELAQLSQNFNRMADDLEGKIHELEDQAQKREQFVGAFSHELKTPLTSIIGYADMLRTRAMEPQQLHLCADYIFSEGKRLENLSMRLLDFIVLKNQALNLADVSVKPLFEGLCANMVPQLLQQDITLTCDFAPATIPMEADLIKTVLLNLIDNSRKAVEAGGQIAVQGIWEGETYLLQVQDNGKGMEQEELAQIREAFYMADKSRSRSQGGVGLGLAICEEIVTLHGFVMSFESRIGVGTIATVAMKGGRHG